MKNLKKLTILHSNDMHGDFLAEQIDEKLVGGVSLLLGYVNQVCWEEPNVLYTVAVQKYHFTNLKAFLDITPPRRWRKTPRSAC